MWRSHIASGPAPWLCARSAATRSRLSCSSGNCPSRDLSGKSLKILKPTYASNLQPSELCRFVLLNLFKQIQVLSPILGRKPVRPTLWVCLRIQTCAPFTPRGSPSCRRTFSWLGESGENVLSCQSGKENREEISYNVKLLWFVFCISATKSHGMSNVKCKEPSTFKLFCLYGLKFQWLNKLFIVILVCPFLVSLSFNNGCEWEDGK